MLCGGYGSGQELLDRSFFFSLISHWSLTRVCDNVFSFLPEWLLTLSVYLDPSFPLFRGQLISNHMTSFFYIWRFWNQFQCAEVGGFPRTARPFSNSSWLSCDSPHFWRRSHRARGQCHPPAKLGRHLCCFWPMATDRRFPLSVRGGSQNSEK